MKNKQWLMNKLNITKKTNAIAVDASLNGLHIIANTPITTTKR
jgi:hypothetical protein